MADEMGRLMESLAMKLAWLLPRRVAMWAAIRVGAHATTGQYGNQIVPDLLFMDAIKRWDAAPAAHQNEEPVDGE